MICTITYEELAGFAEGDLPAERRQLIRQHVESCPHCRQRLSALQHADTALRHLPAERPSAGTILATRRLLAEETRPNRESEILTLEEAAEFLRVSPEELQPFVMDLPAFELGGQIRVRRSRLLEWIEQREREFGRSATASKMARITASGIRKGVA